MNTQQNNQKLVLWINVYVNYLLNLVVERTLKMKRKRLGSYVGFIFN